MFPYLHGDWEVVLGLWWKEDVHGFLLEWCVAGRGRSHLDDVKFAALSRPDGEAEQRRVRRVALHAELQTQKVFLTLAQFS